jgi:hypothetical protein
MNERPMAERLRLAAIYLHDVGHGESIVPTMEEAADRIEALEATLKSARAQIADIIAKTETKE